MLSVSCFCICGLIGYLFNFLCKSRRTINVNMAVCNVCQNSFKRRYHMNMLRGFYRRSMNSKLRNGEMTVVHALKTLFAYQVNLRVSSFSVSFAISATNHIGHNHVGHSKTISATAKNYIGHTENQYRPQPYRPKPYRPQRYRPQNIRYDEFIWRHRDETSRFRVVRMVNLNVKKAL